jgi:hypothetical protein
MVTMVAWFALAHPIWGTAAEAVAAAEAAAAVPPAPAWVEAATEPHPASTVPSRPHPAATANPRRTCRRDIMPV